MSPRLRRGDIAPRPVGPLEHYSWMVRIEVAYLPIRVIMEQLQILRIFFIVV